MAQVLSRQETSELLKKFSKTGNELEQQYQQASNPSYWTSLNPSLTVGSPEHIDWDSEEPLAETLLQDAISNYRTHGFLSLAGMLSLQRITKMRQAVDKLRDAGWLPVFSFLY